MSSFLGRKELSRGVRNNNPGNLVITNNAWKGKLPMNKNTDLKFEQFIDVKHGIRAMIIDVVGDIGKGKNTIRKLIYEYAPPNENNTINYVNVVAKSLGMSPDKVITEIDFTFILNLSRAIITHENGKDGSLITDSDILDAIDILDRTMLNGVLITVKKRPKFNIILIPVLLFFYTVFMISL